MSCPLYNQSLSFTATVTSICCLSALLAILENTAVLLSVQKITSLRKTSRYFMISLAAGELFSTVIGNSFLSAWLILNHYSHENGTALWKMESTMWCLTTMVTTYNLVNVALDRYVAITSPLHYYTKMSSKKCLTLIGFAWLLSFLSGLVVYLIPQEYLPKVWTYGPIVVVLVPLCIIAFCYFGIYRASKGTFPARVNIIDAQQELENKRQRKTALTFGIITVLFFVLFAPVIIFNFIQLLTHEIELCVSLTERKVWICIAVVSYWSAISDPWVYMIRMPEFRAAFKKSLPPFCKNLCNFSEKRCQDRKKDESEIKQNGFQETGVAYEKEIFDTAL